MSTNTKLKAWVRYDGKGKIVPSSLILQAKKPKVGIWKEISTDLCCPICPPLICKRYRNDNPGVETIEGILCGQNTSNDHDVNPGETICIQFIFGTSASFTEVGDCGCP